MSLRTIVTTHFGPEVEIMPLIRPRTEHEAQPPHRNRASAMHFFVAQLGEGEVVQRRRWYRWIGRCWVRRNSSAICNSLAAVWNATFDWRFRSPIQFPKSPLPVGRLGPLSNTMLSEPHQCRCQMAYPSVQRSLQRARVWQTGRQTTLR